MPPTYREELDREELDAIAWNFLRSEFTGTIYADWPIDRRVDAYLLHYSDINRSRLQRRAIIYTYNPARLGKVNEGRFPDDRR